METDNKYIVDEIIDDMVIAERQSDGQIVFLNLNEIPKEVHDGSVLLYDDTGYHLDIDDEALLRKKLRDRLERLKARNTNN